MTDNPQGSPPPIPLTPTHLRPRHDGWTTARQIAFVEALADCGCVNEACQRVGKSDYGDSALIPAKLRADS